MFSESRKALKELYPKSIPTIGVFAKDVETGVKYVRAHVLAADVGFQVGTYDNPIFIRGLTLAGAILLDPPEDKAEVPVGLKQCLSSVANQMDVSFTELIKVVRNGVEVQEHLYEATKWWCKECSCIRQQKPCWKCGPDAEGYRPLAGHDDQVLPDVRPIREIARRLGYCVAEHGSKERDLDLVAVPWTEKAVNHVELINTLAQELKTPQGETRVIGPEYKPHGRVAYNLQLNGWYKLIDISITPLTTNYDS